MPVAVQHTAFAPSPDSFRRPSSLTVSSQSSPSFPRSLKDYRENGDKCSEEYARASQPRRPTLDSVGGGRSHSEPQYYAPKSGLSSPSSVRKTFGPAARLASVSGDPPTAISRPSSSSGEPSLRHRWSPVRTFSYEQRVAASNLSGSTDTATDHGRASSPVRKSYQLGRHEKVVAHLKQPRSTPNASYRPQHPPAKIQPPSASQQPSGDF